MHSFALRAANDAAAPLSPSDLTPPDAPFGIRRIDLETTLALEPVVTFEPCEAVLNPGAPSRTVYRTRDGRVVLTESNGTDAVQIGPAVSRAEAGDLALTVLDSASLGARLPHALFMLALTQLDALAQLDRAERIIAQLRAERATPGITELPLNRGVA